MGWSSIQVVECLFQKSGMGLRWGGTDNPGCEVLSEMLFSRYFERCLFPFVRK